MSSIKLLSEKTINQIAAGEVVDRPVSVIKELVENSLDAGAKKIIVTMERGGKNLIAVDDDGKGIAKDDLALAAERHATSKLSDEDINNICYFGFRGEALPSIGAVSNMKIISKAFNQNDAWSLEIKGGDKLPSTPVARSIGTLIEVKDIFSYTPARLKFMKSDSSEKIAAIDLIERFAIANSDVALKLIIDNKTLLDLRAGSLKERVDDILGEEFAQNSAEILYSTQDFKIRGYAGFASLTCQNSNKLYLFVNNRIVKDKFLISLVKAAYQGLMMIGRYPLLVLFIDVDNYAVDVNVHPAKSEVRFRDQELLRKGIIHAIRSAVKRPMLEQEVFTKPLYPTYNYAPALVPKYEVRESMVSEYVAVPTPAPKMEKEPIVAVKEYQEMFVKNILGHAKFQIFGTYIVSQSDDAIYIVDQHAAHERITLEKFKLALADNGKIESQQLLVPVVVSLGQVYATKVVEHIDDLGSLGIAIERNGSTEVLVRRVPVMLQDIDPALLIKDIADYLVEHDGLAIIGDLHEQVLGNFACHYSIRAGRVMGLEEMNVLLRQIEKTPAAMQCNHGRPTFVRFEQSKLASLFERQ